MPPVSEAQLDQPGLLEELERLDLMVKPVLPDQMVPPVLPVLPDQMDLMVKPVLPVVGDQSA